LSTACWRGHVATWQIENNKLFLIKIEQPTMSANLEEIDIPNEIPGKREENRLHVNWFTGIIMIVIDNTTDLVLFKVENGIIVAHQYYSSEEYVEAHRRRKEGIAPIDQLIVEYVAYIDKCAENRSTRRLKTNFEGPGNRLWNYGRNILLYSLGILGALVIVILMLRKRK